MSDKTLNQEIPIASSESATDNAGRGGYNLLEFSIDLNQSAPYEEKSQSSNPVQLDELIDLLVILGDDMDHQDEVSLADFSDFLLKKTAENKNIDPNHLFRDILIKIQNADLVNTNEILKKICKIYSRTVLIEYGKNQDLVKAKGSAYRKVLHRANQYISGE